MKPPLKQGMSNDFQTPAEALEPLLPYLKKDWIIWECAAGKGNLVRGLREKGFRVRASDIYEYPEMIGDIEIFDFIKRNDDMVEPFDCIITNPPFSLKQEFLERCYLLKQPFALLLPLTTFETQKRQRLFKKYGLEVIFLPKKTLFPKDLKNQPKKL